MTAQELLTRLNAGEVLMIAEWRGMRVDSITYRDKRSGRSEARVLLRHGLECGGGDQVSLVEWTPSGTDAKTVAAPSFTRGQRLLVVVTGYSIEKGVRTVSGTLVADGK